MLKTWTVTGLVIVFRIHTPSRQILTGDICIDKYPLTVCCHHAMHTIFDRTHNQVGIVNRHMLVVDLRFATAEEIRKVNRQEAYCWDALAEFVDQEFSHVDLFPMAVGVGWPYFRYGHTQ